MSEKVERPPLWYLYIIQTQGGRLYTGITTDVQRRFRQHSEGSGAKYFRTDGPAKVVYSCEFPDRSTATREELRVKRLSRRQKLSLIEGC